MKLYGSLNNRLEENKNYLQREIKVGDDITEYMYSDRRCYYVTRIKDKDNIFVKSYEVCANHEKPSEMGHQDWMFFKTRKEHNEYLKRFGFEVEENPAENPEEEWRFRYGRWNIVSRFNLERYHKALQLARKDCSHPEDEECVKRVARFYFRVSDKELEKILSGKEVVKYYPIENGISFGVRDYHYDWEF